jgi:hypothetical protein
MFLASTPSQRIEDLDLVSFRIVLVPSRHHYRPSKVGSLLYMHILHLLYLALSLDQYTRSKS